MNHYLITKLRLILAIITTGIMLNISALAQEDTREAFFGADIGFLKLSGIDELCNATTPKIKNSCEDETYFYRLKASYLLNNSTSVEAFYMTSQVLKLQQEDFGGSSVDLDAELTISNLGLSVSQRLELYERLWATGKVGFHYWRNKVEANISSNDNLAKFDDTGTNFLLGLGIEHRLENDLEVELGIEYLAGGEIDLSNYYFGASYTF